ncbi:MAG: tripartite tricarboxylate transporter TctB family protein [Rhizobiaceae bacterium]|nr:tripartite tricarboxylate transporter TctB family protein [Rhizobiaceae bacterium]
MSSSKTSSVQSQTYIDGPSTSRIQEGSNRNADASRTPVSRITKDFIAGLLFILIGVGATLIASRYQIGTMARTGPGYFPVSLGILLTAFGAVLAIRAYLDPPSSEPLPDFALRPLLMVLLGVVTFGLLIRSWGLVAAIVGLIVVSRFAKREGSVFETLLMIVVLTIIPLAIFVYGLGIPFKVWPF